MFFIFLIYANFVKSDIWYAIIKYKKTQSKQNMIMKGCFDIFVTQIRRNSGGSSPNRGS